MEGNGRFDFCPRCGAVSKDGVCQSCGYQNTNVPGRMGSGPHMYAVPQYQQMQYGAGVGYPQQGQMQYGSVAAYPQQGQMQYGTGAAYPQQYRSCAVVPPAKPEQKKAAAVIYFICLVIVLTGLVIVILAAVNDIENKGSQRGGKNSGTETVQENAQEADGENGGTCLPLKIGTCKAVLFLL